MKIKWHYPLPLDLKGPSPERLELAVEFTHRRTTVKIELSGDTPKPVQTDKKQVIFYRTLRDIIFQIEDIKIDIIQESEYPRLLKIMVSTMNRVLRSIRNTGFAEIAKEINPHGSDSMRLFRRWAVEISDDGKNWVRLLKEDRILDLISVLFPGNLAEIDSSLLPDIEESIQDDITPRPEQEFLVNCIEYLNDRNFRMALVEAIIGLDIVINQYLNSYLSSFKNIPKERISLFIQPQMGLSARIAGLLDLCLHPDEIKKVEFKNVLKAISWRNEIIHRSGHLPEGIPEELIRTNILSVLKLLSLIASLRNQIESLPEMRKIGTDLSEQLSIPAPNIWVSGKHRIIMEFSFISIIKDFPELEKLEAIAQNAILLLSERDKRFIAEEHLYIRFFRFPKELRAIWNKGNIALIPINPNDIGTQSL
jgi:hypothetical protein